MPDDITEKMLPGAARVSITLYDKENRSYRSITGFSVSGLKVKNQRELKRLWKAIERETRAGWRDDEPHLRGDRGGLAAAAGE